MIAGIGRTYCMLQGARDLLDNGIDVDIGYVEAHGCASTETALTGLSVIPRHKVFYRGRELEEVNLDTITRIHPKVAIVNELTYTNVGGSRNEEC